MNWQTLYSARRTGSELKERSSPETIRNSFQRDFDRLIFSSAFRRLQNKTQVFPLPGAVFVHNRLTHSLEVASVGRSLGQAAGDWLVNKQPNADPDFIDFYSYELPSVIAAACLAHDIGNPPFGHSGEEAIRLFFQNLQGNTKLRFQQQLSPNQQRDFLFFEGNANAFRTLTHSFNEPRPGGYQLTYTTLASLVKYPSSSQSGFNKASLVTKKSGFFDKEIPQWQKIAETLHIPRLPDHDLAYARHPFVYLVEAADDICYRIIDFEDAHRLGILSKETIANLFLAFFEQETGYDNREKVLETFNSINDDNQKIQFLRAKVINLLVKRCFTVFKEKEAELLAGNLQKSLIDLLPETDLAIIKQIDQYSVKHIYNHRSVVEIEIAGYQVIGALLNAFIGALMEPGIKKSQKFLQLIPAQFVIRLKDDSLYADLQSVVDFIAGMTDLYAVDLYRRISGLDFSGLG